MSVPGASDQGSSKRSIKMNNPGEDELRPFPEKQSVNRPKEASHRALEAVKIGSASPSKFRAYEPDSNHWQPWEYGKYEMPLFRWTGSRYYRCRYPVTRVARFSLFRLFGVEITVGGVFFFALVYALLGYFGYYMYNKSGKAVKNTGLMASIAILLLFSIAGKNTLWGWLFGVSYERIAIWHKLFTVTVLALGSLHAWVAYSQSSGEKGEVIVGFLLLGVFGFVWLSSYPLVWLKVYRLFWVVHRLSVLACIVLMFMHGAVVGWAGAVIWLADLVFRMVWMGVNRRRVKMADVRVVADGVVELSWSKGDFSYAPGQYVFLLVPEVSFWEPHPFSISSAPHQSRVTLHVKALGDWTSELLKLSDVPKKLSVYIDGPYGNPSVDFDSPSKEIFLLIAGGIGVTPILPYANSLIDQVVRGRKITRLYFVWSLRDLLLVRALSSKDSLLLRTDSGLTREEALEAAQLGQLLDVSLHYTGKIDTDLTGLAGDLSKPALERLVVPNLVNLPQTFRKVEQFRVDQKAKNVVVMCCGPAEMMNEASSLAKKYRYSHHIEEFDY